MGLEISIIPNLLQSVENRFQIPLSIFETLNAVGNRSYSDFVFQEFCAIFTSNKSITVASIKSNTIAINKSGYPLEYKNNATI